MQHCILNCHSICAKELEVLYFLSVWKDTTHPKSLNQTFLSAYLVHILFPKYDYNYMEEKLNRFNSKFQKGTYFCVFSYYVNFVYNDDLMMNHLSISGKGEHSNFE